MNRFFAILAAVLLAGCATGRHQFAKPASTWKSATGQLRYKGSGVSVIGELLVSRGEEGARLEFVKGSSLSLLRIQSDKTHIHFEGPLARGTREYKRGTTLPGHLGVWGLLESDAGKVRSRSISQGEDSITYQLPSLR